MPARVCFTLDNLGDAADLYRGVISQPRPTGQNPPLEKGFPGLLGLFAEFGVEATYFVEGWSAREYPYALDMILKHGHTIGMHGWQHEQWASLTASEAAELSIKASEEITLRTGNCPSIFRAPGGTSNTHTRLTLKQLGYRIDASLAERPEVHQDSSGLTLVPYQWSGVDATHWLWSKKSHEAVYQTWIETLSLAAEHNEHFVFIWHPHVMGIDAERLETGRKLLRFVLEDSRFELTTLSRLGASSSPEKT